MRLVLYSVSLIPIGVLDLLFFYNLFLRLLRGLGYCTASSILPTSSDVVHCKIHVSKDFLPWIENIEWIKDFFCLFKQFYDFFSIHLFEVWCSNQSVIVLSGNRGSFVLKDKIIDFFAKAWDNCSLFGFFNIHQRNNMEIPITDVSSDSINKEGIFFKDLIDGTINIWSVFLQKVFAANVFLKIIFEENEKLPVLEIKSDNHIDINSEKIQEDLNIKTKENKVETTLKSGKKILSAALLYAMGRDANTVSLNLKNVISK